MILQANAAVVVVPPGNSFPPTDGIQISGISVAQAVVGEPVQVVFTVSDVLFNGLETCRTLGGAVVAANGIIVAKFATVQVCVGLFSPIQNGGSAFQNMSTVGTLPELYSGGAVSGSTVTAYVGDNSLFAAYAVGDVYSPPLNVLQASITATGTAPSFPGSGGTTPPPSGTGTGTGTGSGTGTNQTTTPAAPGFWNGLSTTEKVALVGGGIVLVGGGYLLLAGPRY